MITVTELSNSRAPRHLEAWLEREGRELMQQLLQARLDRRAPATPTAPVVGADGVERTHARVGAHGLETVLSRVEVVRAGRGARGRATRFPLDAELNLPPELYSFGVRRRAAEEARTGSCDHVVEVLRQRSGAAVAKCHVETIVRRAMHDFDSYYLERRLAWRKRPRRVTCSC